MAGDWIKMRGNLWDDPRVSRLCDLTECGEAQIIGGLYWLWATADQHTEDGIMPGLSLRQVDRKTGIAGFGEALRTIGWLADHPEGLRICKFEEHNGTSAKRRCSDAQRKATGRTVSASDADKTRTDAGQDEDEKRRLAELEKEKRREEKNSTPPEPIGSDADASSGKPKDAASLTKAELWACGKSLLAQQGMPAAQCGTFVGKLVKDYGDDVVIEAVRNAVHTQPADAASYLKAACQDRRSGRKPKSEADREAMNAHAAAEAKRLLFKPKPMETIDV